MGEDDLSCATKDEMQKKKKGNNNFFMWQIMLEFSHFRAKKTGNLTLEQGAYIRDGTAVHFFRTNGGDGGSQSLAFWCRVG